MEAQEWAAAVEDKQLRTQGEFGRVGAAAVQQDWRQSGQLRQLGRSTMRGKHMLDGEQDHTFLG